MALVTRVGTFTLAILTILWVAISFPKFWTESVVFQSARRIIAGDSYSQDALAKLGSSIELTGNLSARPSVLESLAVVHLRLVEEMVARGEPREVDKRMALLDRTITSALTSSSFSSYQWLALYWVRNRSNGYSPQYLEYLQMSYDTGPLEGWVALRRSRIALGMYAVLNDQLREAALSEYVGLVRSQFFVDAAEIFGNSTPIVRTALIAKLDQLKETDRQALVKIISEKGYWDASLPGVNLVPSRPWR